MRRTFVRLGRVLFLLFTPERPADPATADSPRIPLGLALCIGCAAAAAEAVVLGEGLKKLLSY